MAETQFKVFGCLLYGLHAVVVAVGGGKGLVHREVEVEEVVFGLGAAKLDDFRRHQLQVVVVEAAQGEPNLSMAGGDTESLFTQDGVRDDESGQGLHGLQLLAFFLQMVDELGQQLRRTMPRLGLRGVCSATVEDEFQTERCRCEAAFLHHDFAFLETG